MAMLPDKQVKKIFKEESSQNPDTYYPTTYLKKEGFNRKQCTSCGTYFWTVNESQTVCGDPSCSGGFKVTTDNPVKEKLSYIDVWKKIVEMLEPRGYVPVKRYPVVARWNPTADFVMASIAAFQPYVITGEVSPPAKKLVIPQFSLRFGDVDNVGITGSHLTGFVMIGQHVFVDEDEWNQEEFFKDIYEFLTIGVGLAKEEITIHEDAWAGGGSFGPCLEFFSRGVELFNQVYTMFEQTPKGNQPLKLKVLDMGLGMERIAWFSQGTPNIYEATFPQVLAKLREKTNVEMDHKLYNRFSQYSAYLNVDEVDDIDKAWADVAQKLDLSVEELRSKILPMAGLYSVAEHARTLLTAITDGGLPSNVGGGYNLRVIFRRAQSFIDQCKWDIDLADVAEWHAHELQDIFPELLKDIANVRKILDVEYTKYLNGKEKAHNVIKRIVQKEITTETLLDLYDSQGITPEMIREEAEKLGKKITIPDNFYVLVANLHEKREQVHATQKSIDIDVPANTETKVLYFDDYQKSECSSEVVYIGGDANQYVVLNQTVFYPTSGGQINDTGKINDFDVVDVIKQGKIIIHVVPNHTLKVGDTVTCHISKDRRAQLTRHHTATHVINAAAKKVLGNHINQIGAKKTLDKATLDVTHYESISDEQLSEIERVANEIITKNISVEKFFLPRDKAEQKYGLAIYQGGAIPGNDLRIVVIGNPDNSAEIIDVECCAGTHVNNTKEIGPVKVLKANKISDGVVRLTYVAGDKAHEQEESHQEMLSAVAKLLSSNPNQVPARSEELFSSWKKVKKAMKKGKPIPENSGKLTATTESEGDALTILQETSKILNTPIETIPKTIERFIREIKESG